MNWLRPAGLFILHALIGTVAVFLVAIFLAAVVGHFDDSIANVFVRPVFPGEILLGFFIGFTINRILLSKSAKWIWIFPALGILFDFYSFRSEGWKSTFDYLFGTQCGDCVEQVFTVAPFYGAFAYSLGAWLALRRRPDHVAEQAEKQSSTTRVLLLLVLYSIVVVTAVLVLAFVLVLGTMLVSHSAGRLAMIPFSRPFYVGQIVVALLGGVLAGSRIRPDLAKWVWLLPSISLLIMFIFIVYSAHSTAQVGTAQNLWSRFYTSACANPNIACPQETFGICPFFSSVAYSIGAWIVLRIETFRVSLQSSRSTQKHI